MADAPTSPQDAPGPGPAPATGTPPETAPPAGDVTAVVLSAGETTVERALESLRRQTLPPAEIVIVRDVSPFHAALNEGARRTRTEFLAQVDADMVLEPRCLEVLRGIMTDELGLVRAMRRDPLLGRDSSFKLYRTRCFREGDLPDTAASDVDFRSAFMARGWLTATALRFDGPASHLWHTWLDHLPDYTPRYTFTKYLAEGRRYRYLDHPRGLDWKLGQLRRIGHPLNPLARVGLGRGLFLGDDRESGHAEERAAEFARLEPFLQRPGGGRPPRPPRLWATSPRALFRRARDLGHALAEGGGWGDVVAVLEAHARRGSRRGGWIVEVGLAQGLLAGLGGPSDRAAEDGLLRHLVQRLAEPPSERSTAP